MTIYHRLTDKERAQLTAPFRRKVNKHRNIKTKVDGIMFASKKEAARYVELKLKQDQGLISDLKIQVRFPLLDSFQKGGVEYRGIIYVADFVYVDKDDKTIVEDAKGKETALFKIKKKLFEARYQELELKVV
jgi:hypothetical protein